MTNYRFNPQKSATYIIYNDASGTCAVNGRTGLKDYTGTATAVIQNAITGLGSSGGRIFIKNGYYALTSKLTISNSSICIEGESMTETHLVKNTTADGVFDIGSSGNIEEYIQIKNMYLEGYNYCVHGYVSRSEFSNLFVGGSQYGYGCIHILGTSEASPSAENWIHHNKIIAGAGHGVFMDTGANDSQISDNLIADTVEGIALENSNGCMINNNHIYSTDNDGIYGFDVMVAQITNNQIENCSKNGIFLEYSSSVTKDCIIANNNIWSNGLGTDNTYSGIKLTGGSSYHLSGFVITGNRSSGSYHKYGIELSDYIDNCLIANNWLSGNHSQLSYTSAGGCHIINNWGYNPLGWQVSTPSVPSSTTDYTSTFPFPVDVWLTGVGSGVTSVGITDSTGTRTDVAKTYAIGYLGRVDVGGKIRMTYSGSPTWAFYGL